MDFVIRKHKAIKNKTSIEIHGECYSSCTLYLSMPSNLLCVGENARFFFHKPFGTGSAKEDAKALAWVRREYSDWINNWIDSIGGLRKDFVEMPKHVVLANVRKCD